jgi:hypothetical protein
LTQSISITSYQPIRRTVFVVVNFARMSSGWIGVMTMGARRPTGRLLHVAIAHWFALRAVLYNNDLVYPLTVYSRNRVVG